jgi:hypothetical protein
MWCRGPIFSCSTGNRRPFERQFSLIDCIWFRREPQWQSKKKFGTKFYCPISLTNMVDRPRCCSLQGQNMMCQSRCKSAGDRTRVTCRLGNCLPGFCETKFSIIFCEFDSFCLLSFTHCITLWANFSHDLRYLLSSFSRSDKSLSNITARSARSSVMWFSKDFGCAGF